MSRTRGRAMRYWFESSAGPFHFERLITVKLALAGLLTATVSYLAVNSSANGNSAARNTERYAILTASQNVQGQARYNYDYYGAFRLWQDLNYQGLQAAAQGDTEKADRLKQARDAIRDESALLRPEYAGSIEPVSILPGFYLGSPQLVAYGADLYVGPAAQTQERYSIASRQRDKWSAQGTEYVRTLAAQKDYGHAYYARAEALVDRADGAKAKDAPAAKKDYDAALADYEAAARYAEDEITLAQQAYVSRGRVLYSLGRIDEAVKMDRKALELNPGQNAVRFNLLLALLASGDIEGAQRQFDEGVAAAHESIIEAQAKGGFASPIVFFNLDRAAVGLRSLSTRIAKGDKAGGSAPPVNSIPADKQGAILDKADELYGLARSNAIGLERPTAEVVTNKPASKVLDVSAGLRRADSTIVDKRRSFVPLSKEVTLLVNYSGFQPGQRLTLRVCYYGQLEEYQLRREIAWNGPSSGTYEWDLSYAGKLKSFAPGDYTIEVFLENYLVGTGSFSVETNLD